MRNPGHRSIIYIRMRINICVRCYIKCARAVRARYYVTVVGIFPPTFGSRLAGVGRRMIARTGQAVAPEPNGKGARVIRRLPWQRARERPAAASAKRLAAPYTGDDGGPAAANAVPSAEKDRKIKQKKKKKYASRPSPRRFIFKIGTRPTAMFSVRAEASAC